MKRSTNTPTRNCARFFLLLNNHLLPSLKQSCPEQQYLRNVNTGEINDVTWPCLPVRWLRIHTRATMFYETTRKAIVQRRLTIDARVLLTWFEQTIKLACSQHSGSQLSSYTLDTARENCKYGKTKPAFHVWKTANTWIRVNLQITNESLNCNRRKLILFVSNWWIEITRRYKKI